MPRTYRRTTLVAPAPMVDYDPTRDLRHREARAARELADFLSWLDLGGTARATLETYEWTIAHALRMYPSKAMVDFTDGDLVHVIRRFPPKSRRVRLAAFRSWFKWAKRTRRIRDNPCDLLPEVKRTPQKVIDVFTDAEVAALLGLDVVDAAPLALLLEAGLRKGEARRMTLRHCAPESGQVVVIEGKGGKDRIVPMSARLRVFLSDLVILAGLVTIESPAVLLTPRGVELNLDQDGWSLDEVLWTLHDIDSLREKV